MKNGGQIVRAAVMLVLTAGVLIYFGVEGWRYFADPFTTALAYPSMIEESLDLNGYVVREELVLPGGTEGYLRVERSEGEKVSAGGTIALRYAGQDDLERQAETDTLTGWLEELRDAKTASMSGMASAKLDGRIYTALLDCRAALASGRTEQAVESGDELRALVPRRERLSEDTVALDAKIAAAQERLDTLRNEAAPDVRRITAPCAGLYSAAVDGFESILTPDTVAEMLPSELAALSPEGGPDEEEHSGGAESTDAGEETAPPSLGKLILGEDWYYVAAVPAAEANALREMTGRELRLRFPRGVERDFPVTVEAIGHTEDALTTVVFRGNLYLSEVTLFRQQSAQIVTGTAEGLRVPKEALRLNGGESGLFCVVGAQARFKPVDVLYHGEDFLLVQSSVPTGKAGEGKESIRLRAGDEVIVQGSELEDGKVLTEVF